MALRATQDTAPRVVELSVAVRRLRLPAALVDLGDLTIWAITDAALLRVGRMADEVVGRSVLDLLPPTERPRASIGLDAIRSGAIDFYRTHGRVQWSKPEDGVIVAWVRAIELGWTRYAFVALLPVGKEHPGQEMGLPGAHSKGAVGTMDHRGLVTAVSSDITSLLGIEPAELVGHPLISSDRRRQLHTIVDTELAGQDGVSVALSLPMRDKTGERTDMLCVITGLAGTAGRLFLLMPRPEAMADPDRVSQLEQHLMRIAEEVEASGILMRLGRAPRLARFPQAGTLSPRQWEVLRRLVDGQRVPTIAAELFISQSTVRNHLAAIFERFGVHSQAELLAILAETDTPSR